MALAKLVHKHYIRREGYFSGDVERALNGLERYALIKEDSVDQVSVNPERFLARWSGEIPSINAQIKALQIYEERGPDRQKFPVLALVKLVYPNGTNQDDLDYLDCVFKDAGLEILDNQER